MRHFNFLKEENSKLVVICSECEKQLKDYLYTEFECNAALEMSKNILTNKGKPIQPQNIMLIGDNIAVLDENGKLLYYKKDLPIKSVIDLLEIVEMSLTISNTIRSLNKR